MKIFHALTATFLLFATGGPAQLQQQTPVWSSSSAPSDSRQAMESPPHSREMQERLEKARQSERQHKMIADTDRLLALAAELKASTGKPDKEPPADTLRKMEEIEKLARSVKDRMKG